MGNTSSSARATSSVANVAIAKQREIGHAFTGFAQDAQPIDSAAAADPTFGDHVNSSYVIQKPGSATDDHNVVQHLSAERDDLIGRYALISLPRPTSSGVNLHAFTQNLKNKTQFIKDSVYELVREDDPDVEFVFFHGLQAEPEDTVHALWRTWRMRFSEECWLISLLPKLLNYTEREIKPRVLSVTYDNSSSLGFKSWLASPIDHFDTTEKLVQDLVMTGRRAVGQRHNVPVILVGHDLGGIMIKHFLMKVQRKLAAENLAAGMRRSLRFFWQSLSALVFYATPLVEYPTLATKLPPRSKTPSIQFLRALSKDAARVNTEFESFRYFKNTKHEIPTLRIWESAKTDQGRFHNELVVPRRVRGINGDDDYTAPWEDHFQVCQPTGLHSFTARRFARFVVELIEVMREDEHFV